MREEFEETLTLAVPVLRRRRCPVVVRVDEDGRPVVCGQKTDRKQRRVGGYRWLYQECPDGHSALP